MFTKRSRSQQAPAQEVDVIVVEDDSDTASATWRAKLVPAVGSTAQTAMGWAGPRVARGRVAAAPKVEAAVDTAREKVAPAYDSAREKLEELMPRLVEAVTAAARAGAAAGVSANEYRARSGDAVAVLKGEAVAKRKKGGVLRKLLVLPVLGAAGAAAYAAFRSRAPKEDPWAVPSGTYPAYTPPAAADSPVADPSSTDAGATSLSGAAAQPMDGDSTAQVPGLTVDRGEASTSAEPTQPTSPLDND